MKRGSIRWTKVTEALGRDCVGSDHSLVNPDAMRATLNLIRPQDVRQSRSQRPRSFCTATGIPIRWTKVTEALGTRLDVRLMDYT